MLSERCSLREKLYSNPLSGKIVIVGDRPGPKTNITNNTVPFCSDSGCSGWLNKQLTISEEELRWINSSDFKGIATPYEELEKLLAAEIIFALGVNAAKWISSFNLNYVQVPHPQYWKRFRSKEIYPLIEMLKYYELD